MSAAGKRAGIKDGTRSGLWSVFAEAIDALRPRYVVIENVRGLLSAEAHRGVEPATGTLGIGGRVPVLRAAGAVVGTLADLGYSSRWATVSAASIGAPHRRERVFILASTADAEHVGSRREADDARGWEPDIAGCGGRCESKGSRATSESRSQQIGIDWLRREYAAAVRDGDYFTAEQLQADIDAHSTRDGWHQGRSESAGIVGRSDAAVSGGEPVDPLPTPTAVQGRNETSGRKPGSKHNTGTTLNDVVFKGSPAKPQ